MTRSLLHPEPTQGPSPEGGAAGAGKGGEGTSDSGGRTGLPDLTLQEKQPLTRTRQPTQELLPTQGLRAPPHQTRGSLTEGSGGEGFRSRESPHPPFTRAQSPWSLPSPRGCFLKELHPRGRLRGDGPASTQAGHPSGPQEPSLARLPGQKSHGSRPDREAT